MPDDTSLSYHDVVVYCGNRRYAISDNYNLTLRCTRCGGWELWDGLGYPEEKRLGGEYSGYTGNFCVAVRGIPVVGVIPTEAERK